MLTVTKQVGYVSPLKTGAFFHLYKYLSILTIIADQERE